MATLGSRAGALAGAALFALAAGLVAHRRGGRVDLVGVDRPAAVGFAALVGFFTWLVLSQPLESWSRINSSGTDFLRHLGAIREVRESGMVLPGATGYPKVLHALGAWVTSATGVPTTAPELWRAIAPVGFLMLALMLLGIMSTAGRLTLLMTGRRGPAVLAASLGGLVFVQTAWFSTFLAFGNVMNMVVGVCLIAVLSLGLGEGQIGSGPAASWLPAPWP